MKKILYSTLLLAVFSCLAAAPENPPETIQEGTFTYLAAYETGSKSGTRTQDHKVRVEIQGNDYFLNWGDLRVKADRIANALIYRWEKGEAYGEGVYVFYYRGKKFFGSFLLADKEGESSGHTKGILTSPPAE